MSYSDTKKSKAEALATECIAYIDILIKREYGFHYRIYECINRAWYRQTEYVAKLEQIAIKEATDFVLTHSVTNNIDFIKAVLRHIAVSLAQHAIKNPVYNMAEIYNMPETTQQEKAEKKTKRKAVYQLAQDDMFAKLVKQAAPYLQKIQQNQQARAQERKRKSKIGAKAYNKAKEKATRAQAAKLAKEIDNEFREVAAYKQKRIR